MPATLVYYRPADLASATERVERFRVEGVKAVVRNGAKFHPVQDVEPADAVVCVSDLPVVADAYRAQGVDVTDETAVTLPPAPADLPEPADANVEAKEEKPAPKRRGRRAR